MPLAQKNPLVASKVRSSIPARNVRQLQLKDAKGYRELSRLGIGLDEINPNTVAKMAAAFGVGQDAMDSLQGLITTASITNPIQFLQQWLPGFVYIITQARKIDDLIGIDIVGTWKDEEIIQGFMEPTGSPTSYGDTSNVPLANWNLNWERRTIVRFEQGMRVGILEELRAATAQANSAEIKRNSCGLQLEVLRNYVGFNGFNSGQNRTYGVLNDPNLPNYINVANGASGSPLWSNKTFLEITADIRAAVVQLRTQSGDNIDPEKVDLTLGLPMAAVDFLSVTSDFGNSVRDWLTKTYPRIRVVSVPQFDDANGGLGVFYLFADSVQDGSSTDGGRTFMQMVQSKFQMLGVSKQTKTYEEAYSNGTAGILLKRGYAVVRYSGICDITP